jgi:fatty-acyl-CoA synthase
MFIVDLFKLRILTPKRIIRLLIHVFRNGIQLSNVMHMCDDKDRIALKHKAKSVTYRKLFNLVASVSGYLYATYKVRQGSNALVIVDNSIPSVVLLLALSALGCNIHILRPIKDYGQFLRTVNLGNYDFIFSGIEEKCDYYDNSPIQFITPVWNEAVAHKGYKPFVKQRTRLSIFTSGSTGLAKSAGRSNTLWQYLNAITDVVKTLRLQNYGAVLLPVPIYHSYGLSTLFMGLMLNKSILLVNKFDPVEVGNEIRANHAEVAVLIPQMLHRLLQEDLRSLRCIISCADVLPSSVFQNARTKYGNIIFNLYGTSEAGLATIATPEMLSIRPDTVGKPIKGCKLTLVEENGNKILHVKSGFAINRGYVGTGDIASIDEHGWYYVLGRADDLIVTNGINVYPCELLQMAYEHESVQYAGVKTFISVNGFRRVRMILVAKPGAMIDEQRFKEWWASQYGTKLLPSVIQFKTDDSDIKLMGS